MSDTFLTKITQNSNIKLTDLRKDVLRILYGMHKPMGAYDILEKLKKKRPNAEPPTVYRVLDFLVAAKLVHRIDAKNAYVCCAHLESHHAQHQTILLFCKKCQGSFEYENANIFQAINKFTDKHKLAVDDALIELKGICEDCLAGT